jgi:hypothetical protein
LSPSVTLRRNSSNSVPLRVMVGTRMAQPVYPQLRKYPCVPALTLRANCGRSSLGGTGATWISLADALQGMPVLTGEFHHLLDESIRILMRIDTANAAAVTMGDQHDVDGLFMRFAENAFE